MRSFAAAIVIVVSAVLGALALALAHDARSWRDTLRKAELELAAHPGAAVRTNPETLLPHGLSGRLLSTARDRQWLAAVRVFVDAAGATRDRETLTTSDFRLLERGEDAISPLTRDPDPRRASEAYGLIAELTLREAFFGAGIDPALAEQAKIEFEQAIRLDPNAEAPKQNLELALRAVAAASRTPGNDTSNHRPKTKPRGVSQGAPNSGY